MRLLLDSHILIALVEDRAAGLDRRVQAALVSPDCSLFASVASLWEIAIKARIRKLRLAVPLADLADILREGGVTIVPIEARHATARPLSEPATRDPFDRMLLAQCDIEGLRLVTVDRALVAHPLAWRPI